MEKFLTNFSKKDLARYESAIAEFKLRTGLDVLFVSDKAYDIYHRQLTDYMSLYTSVETDLSLFWQINDTLRDRQTRTEFSAVVEDEMLSNMQYYMEYCLKNEYVTPSEWLLKYKHY